MNTKLSVWLAALGIGTALGQAAEEDAKPEGTHAEIEPIRFGTHPSGKPITIKTIAMNRDGDLLVGISWGEGKMEFAQPRGEDGGSRAGRGGRGFTGAGGRGLFAYAFFRVVCARSDSVAGW